MTGLTNYTADNLLNYLTGQVPEAALPSVWMALFTAVGTDAGTGFTEVTGGGYTRVQVAGPATAAGTISTGAATITMPNVSGFPWVVPGMAVYDVTASKIIGTVLSWVGTTLTLTANSANNGSGSTDVLTFSAFGAGTGTAPSTTTSVAAVTFPQATASWGTALAFGLYDASTAGNLLNWDFLGAFNWLPFEMPTASGTVTAKANGFASNDPLVFTAEYGGTLPTLSTGVMTGYTVAFAGTVATDTFVPNTTSGPTTPFVSTSSGSGMVRKIVQQLIPANITPSFAAGQLVISAA